MKIKTEKTSETEASIPLKSKKSGKNSTRKQIRGSSLLLAGRVISVGLNFVSQVLIVRYLSQADYGAWAYALAVVAFLQGFAGLGLRRGITRFIPIFEEKEEYGKLFGTIILTIGTLLITGVLVIGAIYIAPEKISSLVSGENQPVTLLLILIFMVPVEGFNGALIGLFASFASPKVIFTRKFIWGPGVKLLVVVLLIIFKSNVVFLAYGYLLGNVGGVLFFSWILYRMMVKQGLMEHFHWDKLKIPAIEVFSFTIPLLTSDLVNVVMHASDTLFLGYFHNTAEVALYQVILPAARFNKLVMVSFGLLYVPLAARLFAREDHKGINELYWTTAIWMGVLSFPLFAITFSLAEPLTVFLYGERYAASWIFLQLLSFGYYFNVMLGFNGLTLKVLGRVRYVVIVNITAGVLNLILNLALIPKWGALGATIATATSMIAHNFLKQAGLGYATGISIFDRRYLSFYLIITGGAMGLFLFQLFVTKNIYILLPVAAVVSLGVMKWCQEMLNIEETFPELLKIPFINKILGLKPPSKRNSPEK